MDNRIRIGALALVLVGLVGVVVDIGSPAEARPALTSKQAPPAPGAPKDLDLPAARRLQLDNGLSVTLVPFGGLIPKATVALVVRTGNGDEREDETWLADLTGQMLLQGTRSMDADRLADAAASMGGSLEVAVAGDETAVFLDVLEEEVPDAIGLVADVAAAPRLPATEVERLKADLKRDLAVAMSAPGTRVEQRARELLYPGHAYGRIFPTPEMIDRFTLERVRDFHARGFGPERAHLFVVGRFDDARTEAAIRSRLSGWKGAPRAERPPAAPMGRPKILLIDRPGAVQSVIYLSLRAIDPSQPDYIPLSVTNALLGGGFSSRITANIREKRGYAYAPGSAIAARVKDGHWYHRADVKTDVTGAALREIFKEVDLLTRKPPPERELEAIQSYMAGVFVYVTATRGGLLNQLRQAALYGLGDDYLETYVRKVHAVTPADVQRMMKKYLRRDKMLLVVEGDAAVIEKQLRAFGRVER
jgi:zinc protease